jgi:hypothetical protein
MFDRHSLMRVAHGLCVERSLSSDMRLNCVGERQYLGEYYD